MNASRPMRRIGDREVGAIGFGAMHLSDGDRNDMRDRIAVIHAALDSGVTLIDTADAYHPAGAPPGHNESVVARALASYGGDTSPVLVATKGGHVRPPDGSWMVNGVWQVDGRPEHLRRACEESLRRLGTEAIGLYQLHRPDPAVPYADSVGALRDLLDAGRIRLAGISNANLEQIHIAHDILEDRLASVQNQFSPVFRSSRPELELCDELGIAFLPWAPLGGAARAGSLTGAGSAFTQIAQRRGVSPQQLCLAWELALSPVVIPIPGASRTTTARQSAAAMDLALTDNEIAVLNGGPGLPC